jgi:hypothetical protein
MTIFALFVVTAFVANVIVRDDDSGFGPLVRATRVRKFDYLFGRFAGAYVVALVVFAAVPLGSFIGSLMPWLDPETIGPNRLDAYLRPFVLLAMPTLLLSAAFFFAVATLTRSMMATYVAVVAALLVWGVTRGMLASHPTCALWPRSAIRSASSRSRSTRAIGLWRKSTRGPFRFPRCSCRTA